MKLTEGARPTPAIPSVSPHRGVSDAMRHGTLDLHRKAEGSGFVAALIAGRARRDGYALFLRNLLPAYRALEDALGSSSRRPEMAALCPSELSRVSSLENDLEAISGAEWRRRVPLLPQAESYAQRISRAAAEGDGSPLIAHAYTRYLGDLAGGQILKRCLSRTLGLEASCLSFYEFPEIADPPAFASVYRAALDAACAHLLDVEPVVAEARAAFQLNIDLSGAVEAFVSAGPITASTFHSG